ncbi:DUF4910 domain-containing protein [Leptospira sp. 201903070]|uniref:DUF4910 domain-containing protein n=1 Tax=Leptospira ainlahdjerensis TaxID=2810033 RepID=A0ABS2UAC8_9LEPT|nr:DUF4910 domain-containing protein [Leptospira ainlahdjerensis]MBM9577330.1 DUF4910 domain-containing protein [Leptospira ainlahdjerensis]
MNNYHELIRKISVLDRCHAGPEMEEAYDELVSFYPKSRKIQYPSSEKIYHWELPPYWDCKQAVLTGPDGKNIASKAESNLSVYSYSPSFEGELTLEELKPHLFTNPKKPKSIPFHFRNQYRHRNAEWGFCLPFEIYQSLKPGKYKVKIESNFDYQGKMTQADYSKKGDSPKEIIFMGHFDHPDQVNDGLSGCVASFEVVRRLQDRKTKYSYRAFASVEIVGSVAYLFHEKDIASNLKGGLFLALVGTNEELIYQSSFYNQSRIDRAVKNVLDPRQEKNILYSHREKIGNDENVFDAVGYEIPTGTLLRWPFENYHTSDDNFQNYNPNSTEEMIQKTLEVIDIIEYDAIVIPKFKGIPSLASPEINLYLSPTNISQTQDHSAKEKYGSRLTDDILRYVESESDLLYHFMRIVLRLANGKNTILDICEKTKMPFSFAYWYVKQLEEKGLVELKDVDLL